MLAMRTVLKLCLAVVALAQTAVAAPGPVTFNAHSARDGNWSDTRTWADGRAPKAGDFVQVRAGHTVNYDVNSDAAIRMVHVAGTLTFVRDKSTRLDVGLIKVEPGESTTEDGFNCHDDAPAPKPGGPRPTLELGTRAQPIPAGITSIIRLVHFTGTDTNTLPAIVNCGGTWDVHGAPMNRTWVKLAAPAKPGDSTVTLQESVTGWRVGDRVLITASKESHNGNSYRPSSRRPKPPQTEERFIAKLDGAALTLDKPLANEHFGDGATRSEVANLSRNVIIESAKPDGVRGHTMYHSASAGGISYAEFRHLGKEGVLGKYAIHFHLVRDTMRGSGVTGASIWDSHNRWITIHGTDYLLVRDCVGYQSVGHGFFLEDATEQYNVLDRNLAVQAYRARPLPKQVLPFDANDGAGFWWANGRNTFTRNVSCENDEYGYRFEIAKRSNFSPLLAVRRPDGEREVTDVRTLPFLRFEDNESHSEGLYSFNFGDDVNGSVRGDRRHPFIARNLRAWETHYVLRPNLQFFLMDGLQVDHAAYGVYHPDYDAHVYRNLRLNRVDAEPINRGHDDESVQHGSFTYENVLLENCRIGRDPLIQLACTSPGTDAAGHFQNVAVKNSESRYGKVVDLGGGPRNSKLSNPVAYYFHDYFGRGEVTKVVSAKFPEAASGADFHEITGFTGKDVRAAEVKGVAFPTLLDPVDDLPPATMITSVRRDGANLSVCGITQDNGDIAAITVNGHAARIVSLHAGVADWEISLAIPADGRVLATAADKSGNVEKTGHEVKLKQTQN
jgi:hypothetical protein